MKMIWLRIVSWAMISCGLGNALNWLLVPADEFYSAVIYLVPFLVLGFQETPLSRKHPKSIIGMPLYSEINYKRLTFWGIPISPAKEILPDFGPMFGAFRERGDAGQVGVPVVIRKLLLNL